MGETTKIQWTDHTHNPFMGCRKVAPECLHCYIVDTVPMRSRHIKHGSERVRTSEANRREPYKWDRQAEAAGIKAKVFCLSLGDWLDDEVDSGWLADLLEVMSETPNLIWQLLTKRPQNFRARLAAAAVSAANRPELERWIMNWLEGRPRDNVWIGVSAGADQLAALNIPARLHFLSCEPMLYPAAQYTQLGKFGWVIFGGESGKEARPCYMAQMLAAVRRCQEYRIPVFVKQMGSNVIDLNDEPVTLKDSHGGDWSEWPLQLRIREFPKWQR